MTTHKQTAPSPWHRSTQHMDCSQYFIIAILIASEPDSDAFCCQSLKVHVDCQELIPKLHIPVKDKELGPG